MATDLHAGEDANTSLTLMGVAHDDSDRNPIFDALVTQEGEVAGLVAYSLYKQNKRSWIEDFKRLTGRLPNEDETRAYIIGESTERRLATYRLLAQTTLGLQAGASAPTQRGAGVAAAVWALIAVMVLAGIGYVMHAYGLLAK